MQSSMYDRACKTNTITEKFTNVGISIKKQEFVVLCVDYKFDQAKPTKIPSLNQHKTYKNSYTFRAIETHKNK